MTHSPDRSSTVGRRRAQFCAAGAALLAFVAAVLLASGELGGLGGDDAEYVLLAKALRERLSYVTTWAVGEPSAHTTYPPLFALLLVPFVGSAPESFQGVHVLLAVASGAAVGLLTLLGARRGLPPLAAAAAALGAALSALWLRCASDVLSELPFLVFVTGALLALHTRDDASEERTSRAAVLAATCAGAAMLTRTAGIALVPWVLLALVLPRWRGGRGGRRPALGLVVMTAGWFAYGALAGSSGTYVDVLASGEGASDASFVTRFWNSLAHEYLPHLPAFVFPDSGALWTVAGWVLWGLAAIGIVGGVARARRVRATEGFALTYLAMLCAWNFRDPRFGIPLIPFVALFALEGASILLSRARANVRTGLVVAIALAFLAPNAMRYATKTRPRAVRTTPAIEGAPPKLRTPDAAAFHATWGMTDEAFPSESLAIASYLAMCDAIRTDASAPAGPVMASNPRVAALLTGRQATTTSRSEDPSAAIARMRASGVQLLLIDSFVDSRSSAVRELVRRHGAEMGEIGRVGNAHLFRLRPTE